MLQQGKYAEPHPFPEHIAVPSSLDMMSHVCDWLQQDACCRAVEVCHQSWTSVGIFRHRVVALGV